MDKVICNPVDSNQVEKIVSDFFSLFFLSSGRTWQNTSWMGVPITQNPFDLWVKQEIIFEIKPDLIIETGTYLGGGTLFYASLMDLIGKGEVISIDMIKRPFPQHNRITYITGNSTDKSIINYITTYIRRKEFKMVIVDLDSDHSKKHVLEEIKAYNGLVTVGSYMIVEDTCVEETMQALQGFISTPDGKKFDIDKSREKYYFTFYPNGYLKKKNNSTRLT